MKYYAIIPARYASQRFPGKALAILRGKPVIQHVYERVADTGLFDKVIVATDDKRIQIVCQSFGAEAVITDPALPSGTDRVAAVALSLEQDSVILNVQGDEPLISKEPLTRLLTEFEDSAVQMASLMTPLTSAEDMANPNIVKLVLDRYSNALYFSRQAIPFDRDKAGGFTAYRHIGVYAFRYQILMDFVALPVAKLEQIEKLEQLRALENGIPIRMVLSDYQGIGIDTPQDLVRVESIMAKEF